MKKGRWLCCKKKGPQRNGREEFHCQGHREASGRGGLREQETLSESRSADNITFRYELVTPGGHFGHQAPSSAWLPDRKLQRVSSSASSGGHQRTFKLLRRIWLSHNGLRPLWVLSFFLVCVCVCSVCVCVWCAAASRASHSRKCWYIASGTEERNGGGGGGRGEGLGDFRGAQPGLSSAWVEPG